MNSNHEHEERNTENLVDKPNDTGITPPAENESAVSDLMHILGFGKRKGAAKKTAPASSVHDDKQLPVDSAQPLPPVEATAPPAGDVADGSDNSLITTGLSTDAVPGTASFDSDASLPTPMVPAQRKRISKKVVLIAALMTVFGAGFVFALPYLNEPTPPSEDVVASYYGKYITVDELKKVIVLEQAKESEHAYCEKHGYDHSKCDPTEACEAHPIDTLEGYRQMVTNFAVEQIIQEWASAQGITQREDVQHGLKDMVENASVNQLLDQLHATEITPESISSWEVQQYYDDNLDTYTGKALSEVEDEIRQILVSQKDADFFTQYIEELKQTAGLQVDLDILKVSEPTETEITAYYNENIDLLTIPETAQVLEIKITSGDVQSLGTEAIRKIRSGESFESVAAAYDPDGKAGELTVAKGAGDDAISAVVWSMQPGDISDPIANADQSVSILKLAGVTDAGTRPLSEVKSYIRLILLQENMDSEYALRKDEALFTVHGRRYTLGEFYTEFKELSPEYQSQFLTYEQKQQLAEQLIVKELLLEKTGDSSTNEADEHRMEELKIQYLAQILHQQEVDEKLTAPTEEEMQKFYNENKKSLAIPASVQISLIWIDQGANGEKTEQAKKKAEEALALLKSGTDFAEVAKQYSEDSSAPIGGEIAGAFDQSHLPPELGTAIFTLKPGENTGILDYDYGYFIIKVLQRAEERQMTYEESAGEIQAYLSDEKHHQAESQMEQLLLENADFTIYDKTLRRLLEQQNR